MYRQISLLTVLLLVLLRLAIGWHFLFEGVNKIRSTSIGETVTNKPFSSAGFFREATGPLGPVFRSLLGDPDTQALALLTVEPRKEGVDTANDKPHERMPKELNKQWLTWAKAFESHYGLDEKQRDQVTAKIQQEQSKVVRWLEESTVGEDTHEVKTSFPTGDVVRKVPTAERIRNYQAKLAEVRDLVNQNWTFGKDVSGPQLRKVKSEAAEMRNSLLKDLDEYTKEMQKAVETVPTKEQKEKGPVPTPQTNPTLSWIDFLTRWGLTIIGGGLLIGFLTRTNCLLAAGFLLTTYLCAPAFPWLPVPPQNEGNYVFVNKNLIEMFALLALATTASGRWFGLDGLFYWGWRLLSGKRPANA